MERQIVVAFRMPPAGMSAGPDGAYLARARSMCSRGEALGGRLVAWGAALIAMAWDEDSIEEAVLLATSLRQDSSSLDRAWTCGIAEGELESLAPDGQRMHLAWGDALLASVALARAANAGEILVDGDVRALAGGHLVLLGARSAVDGGQRVRGWRLDVEHPWRQGAPGFTPPPSAPTPAPTIFEANVVDIDDEVDELLDDDSPLPPDYSSERGPLPSVDFTDEELSTSDVLHVIEASALRTFPQEPTTSERRRDGSLADRVRALSRRDSTRDPVIAIAELRRARSRAEAGPPAIRCQAALALAMILSIAGRTEEALLEALDALASARTMNEPKAISACVALLSKLYAAAGFPDAASMLKETAAG